MKQLFTNNGVTLLAEPITVNSTSLKVIAGTGGKFPNPGANEFFTVTLEDESATRNEIIRVTSRVGDTFYFSSADRGFDGTIAQNWSAGVGGDTLVDHRLTAHALRNMLNDYANAAFPSLTDLKSAIDFLLSNQTGSINNSKYNVSWVLQENVNYTILEFNDNYKPLSTRVFLGGIRLKLGEDYMEVDSNTIRINFLITNDMIAQGQNIVVDYDLA